MSEFSAADPFGLKGRVCVVTGAGSGIGRAVALTLGGAGGRIAVLDRNEAGSMETVKQVQALGAQALALTCDTSDPDSVHKAAQRSAAELGPCEVLVNSAGVLRPGALESLSLAEWNQVLSVNLTGYFLCAQAFGRQMRENGAPGGKSGGALVHIASIAAEHATAFTGSYSVAKAGITMLSRQLALEWGGYGIRSNTVHPGLIVTPMSQAFYDVPGTTERRSKAVPAGRLGRPEDIAQAVLFLASPRSAYISGEEITVDGGFTRMLMGLIPRAGYESNAN